MMAASMAPDRIRRLILVAAGKSMVAIRKADSRTS